MNTTGTALTMEEFIARPYASRQMIVVMEDEAAKATRFESKTQAQAASGGLDWSKVASAAAESVFGTPVSLIAAVTVELLKAWAKARKIGVEVTPIGRVEARFLDLPPGHPRDGVVYVAHPALPLVYLPAAEFHRFVFEHKFSEAVQLLMSLGASTIAVEHVTGWSQKMAGNLSVPLPSASAQIGSEVKTNHAHSSNLLYEATLCPSHTPRLPDSMTWFEFEPTWKAISDGRLRYGLQGFSLSVRYEDDFGVNGQLKSKIEKAGLEIGGNFSEHVSTSWSLRGVFAEAPSKSAVHNGEAATQAGGDE